MIFEGNSEVIDALKEKKRLKDAGAPHSHIKPLLVIDGGLMKGAYSAGAVIALEELGYTSMFADVVGISSGAPTAAYFVSGEVSKGVSLYWEECCSRKFINMWRFWNQVNTFYFAGAIRGVTGKGISPQEVFSSSTELHIGVADFKTGEPRLLTPTDDESLYTAIQASILMPNVSSDRVHFDDIRYVDGGFTRPHILKKVIDVIDTTHVLIITNQDQTITAIPRLERFLNHTLYRHRMPKALRFAAHERRRERMKVLEEMEKNYKNPYALVWGDHSIRSVEQRPQKIKRVIEASRKWWYSLLEEKE